MNCLARVLQHCSTTQIVMNMLRVGELLAYLFGHSGREQPHCSDGEPVQDR